MLTKLALLRKVFFYGYTLMLLGIGASGILIARWELINIFDIPLPHLAPQVQATMLNQYRFLKSAEFSFGLFCYFFRASIFERADVRYLFVSMVFVGVGARLLSVIVDGMPSWPFLAFAFLELVTGILVSTTPQATDGQHLETEP